MSLMLYNSRKASLYLGKPGSIGSTQKASPFHLNHVHQSSQRVVSEILEHYQDHGKHTVKNQFKRRPVSS